MKSLIVCLCLSCLGFLGHALSAQERVRALRPLEQCKWVSDLNDQVDKVEVIPLQHQFDAQSMEWFQKKLLIGPKGDLFLKYGREILCFEANGKYLFSIKYNKDEGCPFNHDACISLDGKRLLFARGDREIVFYDLVDGHEIERLQMDDPSQFFEEIAPGPDGGFYYYNISAPSSYDFEPGYLLITRFDRKGQKLESAIPQSGYTVNAFLVSQSSNNTYLIRTQGGDNACYRIDKQGELRKAYTVDFGDKSIPDSYGKEKGDLMLSDYMRADYYKMPIYFSETGSFLCFSCCGPQAEAYNFLYPRDKDTGIYWKGDPEMEIHFFAADEHYFYTIIEPATDELMANTQDPLLQRILAQAALFSRQKPSAYVVKVKFK